MNFGSGDRYQNDGLEVEVFILQEKAQLGQKQCKVVLSVC